MRTFFRRRPLKVGLQQSSRSWFGIVQPILVLLVILDTLIIAVED